MKKDVLCRIVFVLHHIIVYDIYYNIIALHHIKTKGRLMVGLIQLHANSPQQQKLHLWSAVFILPLIFAMVYCYNCIVDQIGK